MLDQSTIDRLATLLWEYRTAHVDGLGDEISSPNSDYTVGVGAALSNIGGRQLMTKVIESAEDKYGVTIASWLHRVWTVVPVENGKFFE